MGVRIGDNEFSRSAMIFDYSSRSDPFDAFRRFSMHILRTLYILAMLYIGLGIG
jgi:hypothetical protein